MNEKDEFFKLATAYLKAKGWQFYAGDDYVEDVWLLPGIIIFEGDDSAERAIRWQIKNWFEK